MRLSNPAEPAGPQITGLWSIRFPKVIIFLYSVVERLKRDKPIISYFGIYILVIVVWTPMASAFPAEYREFLKCLKNAREEAGLTQVDAARGFKKPQSFISKSESGERRVDPVELGYFAEIYGKSISYFY